MFNRPREAASARAGRLYDEPGVGLYRYALMLLADRDAAEDAIHQVFATLLRNNGPIDNEVHYLRRAVRNECYSMLRVRVRRGEETTTRPLLEPAAHERVCTASDQMEKMAAGACCDGLTGAPHESMFELTPFLPAGGAGRGLPARRAGATPVTDAFGAEDGWGDPATGPGPRQLKRCESRHR